MPTQHEMIQAILLDTAVYIQYDENTDPEGIRVNFCDDDHFIGIGEETGDSYQIKYSEVDLEKDTFYTLAKLDVLQYSSK